MRFFVTKRERELLKRLDRMDERMTTIHNEGCEERHQYWGGLRDRVDRVETLVMVSLGKIDRRESPIRDDKG